MVVVLVVAVIVVVVVVLTKVLEVVLLIIQINWATEERSMGAQRRPIGA